MNIAKIATSPTESYFPREIKFETAKQIAEKTAPSQDAKLNAWQKDILINALDKLVNNIQVDNSHPLGRAENAPIETRSEAFAVLETINSDYLSKFGSQFQANISAASFMNLVMEN